ncbi:4Fe-4S dicluster domain-containing protein [Clostridium sp. CM028]|uniref:4Fe-4S dicluster domain-containing protein n=1 Tax=Clostridium sp. CM028 TaxID=2851575 RepID=UPI001C6EBEAB|nr:4Fe-4S dicluster domain-containing protein [Clostridium sp. CM028]MBW9149899.1 4Fe-4S dicluster domain-containing protein [Clostridium sp. CM028]WLC63234.1 4Fe-4S dicluster domain-containing protein [Clostridium sp. CM028]
MKHFDNDIQLIKYEVITEVVKLAIKGTLKKEGRNLFKVLVPGPKARTRCCIHKERAIIGERIKLVMGGCKKNKNVIEVISIACDECPIQRFTVTEACRGCLTHKCIQVCPVDAIHSINRRSYIDTEKCIECGKCEAACPYNAISDVMRPCRRACSAGALSIDEDKKAVIDNDKCIQCGACVYQCPFGAIMDKSSVVDITNTLIESKEDKNMHVYAVVAPAIASQFTDVKIGQVLSGIKKMGFYDVVEAAIGADMVVQNETKEFIETIEELKTMTSSCCPAFVSYIKKNYPELGKHVSSTVSPMIAISKLIKNTDPLAKVVFIGPCTAKKMEIKQSDIKGITDYVMTFEELQAMLEAFEIDLQECEELPLNNASYYGRIFAKAGGLTEAVKHLVDAENVSVEFKPISCDGLIECDKALKLLKFNRSNGNFIEGMACSGGCIGGAASLKHGSRDKNEVNKYGKLALEKDASDSLKVIKVEEIDMHRGKNFMSK